MVGMARTPLGRDEVDFEVQDSITLSALAEARLRVIDSPANTHRAASRTNSACSASITLDHDSPRLLYSVIDHRVENPWNVLAEAVN